MTTTPPTLLLTLADHRTVEFTVLGALMGANDVLDASRAAAKAFRTAGPKAGYTPEKIAVMVEAAEELIGSMLAEVVTRVHEDH